MRKGDAKRQEMLNAAEKLFCSRGYDATSVQDILNVLHASKGGFYHHFSSKEDVLRTLISQRAERASAYAVEQLANCGKQVLDRFNTLLHCFMPLRRDEVPFVRMLMPLIERPEGRAMAMMYQDALRSEFQPMLAQIIHDGVDSGVLAPPVKDMESVLLHLANQCWMEVVGMLLQVAHEGVRYDVPALLATLEKYRRTMEVLLDAPYGSVVMIRIEEWDEVSQRLLRSLEN